MVSKEWKLRKRLYPRSERHSFADRRLACAWVSRCRNPSNRHRFSSSDKTLGGFPRSIRSGFRPSSGWCFRNSHSTALLSTERMTLTFRLTVLAEIPAARRLLRQESTRRRSISSKNNDRHIWKWRSWIFCPSGHFRCCSIQGQYCCSRKSCRRIRSISFSKGRLSKRALAITCAACSRASEGLKAGCSPMRPFFCRRFPLLVLPEEAIA